MNVEQLTKLARAVCGILGRKHVVVLGSSALLVRFPQLGEPGEPIHPSLDADFVVTPITEGEAAIIGQALGSGRSYQDQFGCYADLLRPEMVSLFPRDWEGRLIPLPGCDSVFCLDEYDVAVLKLRVGREKDTELIRYMIRAGMLHADRIEARLFETPMPESEIVVVHNRLDALSGS